MEPVNPLLPALRPDTPGLLRRAGGLINAVRNIQQEASAEYWYGLAMVSSANSETKLAYAIKSERILRHEIATIRRTLEIEKGDEKYQAIDSDDGENWGYYFDTVAFYDGNQNTFARLHECYTYLVNLADSSTVKADTWIELAELLIAYELPVLASQCYISSFTCENRLQTVLEESKLRAYYRKEGWDSNSGERILSYDEAIERFPDYLYSYYLRSEKNSREGRYDAALNDLNTYLSLSKSINPEFYRYRGRLHYKLGNTFAARQDAADVLRLGGRLGNFMGGYWSDPEAAPF